MQTSSILPPFASSSTAAATATTTSSSNGAHQQQQHRRPLHQFPVTKLRSWRTGYVRWLVLYEDEFGTVDPTSTAATTTLVAATDDSTTANVNASSSIEGLKLTNVWSYHQLTEWMAVPGETDTILLQVSTNATSNKNKAATETLKFACQGNVPRAVVLTALLRQRDWVTTRYSSSSSLLPHQHPQPYPNHNNNNITNTNRLVAVPAMRNHRTGRQSSVLLQLLPYGIAELHAVTRQRLQTYLLTDLVAVSFPAAPAVAAAAGNSNSNQHQQQQQQSGIFLHFCQIGKVLFYTIADENSNNNNTTRTVGTGGGRTALLTALQDHNALLGLDALPMAPSFAVDTWLERRRKLPVGPTAVSWNVTKNSKRHDSNVVGTSSGQGSSSSDPNDTMSASQVPSTPGGVVSRQLSVTGKGYLVERDTVGIVNVRRLRDLQAIVRHPIHSSFVLEFVNGSNATYSVSRHRDAILVTILDAALQFGQNNWVHITDISCEGYCLMWSPVAAERCGRVAESASRATPKGAASGAAASAALLFASTPVPLHTLKRVYASAIHLMTLVSGELGSTQQSAAHIQEQRDFCARLAEQGEMLALVTACREFNATVQNAETELGLSSSSLDKCIVGTMGALFGLVGKLLLPQTREETPRNLAKPQQFVHRRLDNERVAGTLIQTLCRLAKTETGYKCSADLTTIRDCIPSFWNIDNVFCKYGAFSVLNTLLSGTNKDKPPNTKRDMEAEYVNKNVLLKSGGQSMIHGLVSALLPIEGGSHDVSDMILMVTSDILQSLLCSYHDTTSPEHFQAFIGALAQRYRALLSTLRSPTPFVIENTALLLHLLSTHAPASCAAIRDAALSSATLLQHFYLATFSPLEGQRFLSRYLCSLWFSGPMHFEEKRLLKRMVPHGFLAYLSMPALSRVEEEQLDEMERDPIEGNIKYQGVSDLQNEDYEHQGGVLLTNAAGGTNTSRLRARIGLAGATVSHIGGERMPVENFRIFFHVLSQDHALADLIWSQQTRRELRIALEKELEYIRRETEARGIDSIAWNHQQFIVEYPSLESEVKVGDIYMRLWLDAGDGFIRSWDEPVRLFEHLFRRFLCEIDRDTTVSGSSPNRTLQTYYRRLTPAPVHFQVTVMCIRCLERLYAIHAAAIGPFTDVLILVRSMASTKNVETQHRLLSLLATVLGVSGDMKDMRYSIADIPENAEQLLNLSSIFLLCQFVAWGHTNVDQYGHFVARMLMAPRNEVAMLTEDTAVGRVSTGITSRENATETSLYPPVWFIACTGRIPPPQESIKGPFQVSDLRRMMVDGDLTPYDLVTTSHVEEYDTDVLDRAGSFKEADVDTGKWKRLNQVWQLRWQLCSDKSASVVFSPTDVAVLALKALVRLVDLHRCLDSRGCPYVPIPTAKRILCGSGRDPNSTSESTNATVRPLQIVCQALLCNDSKIVEQTALLVSKLCQHNEHAVSKLYLTGMFYFSFCYSGSDFQLLAKLIYSTHLSQHFKSGFAATADERELPLKDRSILGHMLPEGLLFVLTNYGPDRFAEVFVGNADTPEAIWTFQMRKHLIEMIRQHLGDFPLRLFQNNTAEYDYCPMPGVAYKRLEKEIFCHNYYLHNLCDETRFPAWPIVEPVEVFRACLERFKKQVNNDKASDEESMECARALLGLKAGDGSKELRKAYRTQARKFHPDKVCTCGNDLFSVYFTCQLKNVTYFR